MSFGVRYALVGWVLSFGAPLGSLSFHYFFGNAGSLMTEFLDRLTYYLYMTMSTMTVFTVFGFVLGHHADVIRRQKDAFRELSVRDSLTGAYNRRYYWEVMEREFTRAERYNLELSLLLLDIDHFKIINDRFGHACGDDVLRNVASLVQSRVREADLFARVGGEEFVLLLPETNLDDSVGIAEALRTATEVSTTKCGTHEIRITISLGVCSFQTSHPASPSELFDHADSAMYRAKRAGRNCVAAYERERV